MKINPLKTTLLISLIGILFLLILSNFLQPRLIEIKDINDNLLNKKVRVQGEILNIKNYEDSSFQVISIRDETGKIDLTTNKILNLTNSQRIAVIGTVTEYNQYLQIQADKIFLIK